VSSDIVEKMESCRWYLFKDARICAICARFRVAVLNGLLELRSGKHWKKLLLELAPGQQPLDRRCLLKERRNEEKQNLVATTRSQRSVTRKVLKRPRAPVRIEGRKRHVGGSAASSSSTKPEKFVQKMASVQAVSLESHLKGSNVNCAECKKKGAECSDPFLDLKRILRKEWNELRNRHRWRLPDDLLVHMLHLYVCSAIGFEVVSRLPL